MDNDLELSRVNARLDRIEDRLRLRPPDRPRPPFYGLTPASGLHILKDGWNQVASMEQQCTWLHQELDLALEATRVLAPDRSKRRKSFQLGPRLQQVRPSNIDERQLEWDIFDRWGLKPNGRDAEHAFWRRLVGFQVPLYDNNLHDGWDKIDLVGIDQEGLPVVIELKKAASTEKPLRPLLEVAAYAVALRKVWPAFCRELTDVLSEQGIRLTVQSHPTLFRLVVLAPADYWVRLSRNTKITAERWKHFGQLLRGLEKSNYPVSLCEVSGEGTDLIVRGVEWLPIR